jgi:4-oxalocrotonate tautomerase
MPELHVYMLPGRTAEQKRGLIEGLTGVMVDVGGAERERVVVLLHEVEAEHWGSGGVPMSEAAAGPAESSGR